MPHAAVFGLGLLGSPFPCRSSVVLRLPGPGEILREEFMKPLGVSAITVAKACHVPRTRIERIVREEIGISADTALRLSKVFNTTPEFWLNLQIRYDTETTAEEIGAELDEIHGLDPAA